MWKLAMNRIIHSRNIVTTSLRCVVTTNQVFSESKYFGKKQSASGGAFSNKKPNYFERRGTSRGDDNWADEKSAWNGNIKKTYQRKSQFDGDEGDADYWADEKPAWNNKPYQKKPQQDGNYKRNYQFDGDESPEKNANLSVIGVPSKWKVGANFEIQAASLRNKVKRYSDFSKKIHTYKKNYTHEDPSVKSPSRQRQLKQLGDDMLESRPSRGRPTDPGLRRQLHLMDPFDKAEAILGEDFDNEVDVMKFEKLYDTNKEEKEAAKELLQMNIVKQKYFKEPKENTLSWSDKEHIRYLHNTDPEKWTFEIIAEQFKIDFHVAKAVATAKWLPDKPKTKEGLISEENLVIADPTNQPLIQVESGKDENSRKIMNWKELSKSMGIEEEPVQKVSEKSAVYNERLSVLDGIEYNQELMMRYTSGENPLSKWAESEAELKIDTDSKNVYYYDSKHGYQHPLGKPEEADDSAPVVKEGQLLRKGDSFYSEEGEFLYRVPGISK